MAKKNTTKPATTETTNDDTIVVRDEFKVHLLNDEGLRRANDVAKLFSVFLNDLESQCGAQSHEMALVRIKLQEAAWLSKRAMASDPDNQVDEE